MPAEDDIANPHYVIQDPRDVNMLPNHFCRASRSKTLKITPVVVAMVWGGWAPGSKANQRDTTVKPMLPRDYQLKQRPRSE